MKTQNIKHKKECVTLMCIINIDAILNIKFSFKVWNEKG